MRRMQIKTSALITTLSLWFAVGSAFGQATKPVAPGPENNPIRGAEITDAQKRAVERGLTWLAARQAADGSFGGGEGGQGQPAAITALSALAFMQAGNLPGRGKYGVNVRKATEYVLSVTSENGLIAAENAQSVMYGHGFATLFLAEVYGMTGGTLDGPGGGDVELKEKLTKAVRLIIRSQNPQGGWRYNPRPEDADISVTICQIMALRAARDAGIQVDKAVIDRAIEYVRNCQNADGGFSYMARMGRQGMLGGNFGPGGPSGYARTAAGVASLFYAGVYEGQDVKIGLEYIAQFIPGKNAPEGESHYFYGNYYAVQAMFLAGGNHWGTYYPAIREELIQKQNNAGSWSGDFTDEYATAMALLILQMPNRYLPVFIGKGPGN